MGEKRCCFLCDKPFVIQRNGVAHHLYDDGDIDHDEDADHTPYTIDEDGDD